MSSGTLYDILSIAPDAGEEEVRAAFRRLSKRVHPDAGGSDELFAQVKNAFDTLSDPGRRAEYDLSLRLPPARTGDASQVQAYGPIGYAPTVSLVFSGSLSYTNRGYVTSGSLNVKPPTGAIGSVTGTLTIPGTAGGEATVALAIARVLGGGVGIITVSDPGAHVETGAIVLSNTLSRAAAGQVTGTASGISGVRPYTLHFTV